MSIIESRNGDETILSVKSLSLAGEDAVELKAKAVNLIESGVTKISLNLKQPEYIDSSGIGKLLFMNKKMDELNGEFQIIEINSTLYEFLASLAITEVMKISQPT